MRPCTNCGDRAKDPAGRGPAGGNDAHHSIGEGHEAGQRDEPGGVEGAADPQRERRRQEVAPHLAE